MIDLEVIEWDEFNIAGDNGLFNIFSSTSEIDKKNLYNGGSKKDHTVAYVTRSGALNGVSMLVDNKQDDKYKKNPGNVITIGLDTQTVFYQSSPFYTGQNVHVMTNSKLNKEIAMFIIPILRIQMGVFGWGGTGATLGRLERTRVMLPIDESGDPAWDVMEKYIKQQTSNKKRKYRDYIKKKNKELERHPVPPLDEMEWDTFFLIDIFDKIQRGKRLIKKNQRPGRTPYVSSTGLNNGVANFLSNEENVRIFSDCLTIANSGTVGSTFYHPYRFVASDHVTHLKSENMNGYVYLFIATLLNRLSSKYGFNREMNDKRIKRETVILPTTEEGTPDFEYMEQYVINLILDKSNQYLNNTNMQ